MFATIDHFYGPYSHPYDYFLRGCNNIYSYYSLVSFWRPLSIYRHST